MTTITSDSTSSLELTSSWNLVLCNYTRSILSPKPKTFPKTLNKLIIQYIGLLLWDPNFKGKAYDIDQTTNTLSHNHSEWSDNFALINQTLDNKISNNYTFKFKLINLAKIEWDSTLGLGLIKFEDNKINKYTIKYGVGFGKKGVCGIEDDWDLVGSILCNNPKNGSILTFKVDLEKNKLEFFINDKFIENLVYKRKLSIYSWKFVIESRREENKLQLLN